MPIRHVKHALCLPALSLIAALASAQNLAPTLNMPDSVWRCSLDGKLYTLANADGLHIRAVATGQFAAEIPAIIDKKGKTKMEGRWGSSLYGGLVVIQNLQLDSVTGYLYIPNPGATAMACNSRKASVLFSFGQTTPICSMMKVTWNLQPGITPLQGFEAEMQNAVQAANSAPTQSAWTGNTAAAAPGVDASLVGVWSNETATAVSYTKTRLQLSPDGTYTKSFGARPPTMGGGVVGAGTFGDTHSGTWSVVGPMQVRLSGDNRHTPYTQNLSALTRQ